MIHERPQLSASKNSWVSSLGVHDDPGGRDKFLGEVGTSWASVPRMPPLLPVLLPLVIAAIVIGVLFAWLFPPVVPGQVPPVVRFTDVSAAAGLRDWPNRSLSEAPTTLGGGVVCLDYDVDGDIDLLFVRSSRWDGDESMAKTITRGSCALFSNDGTGRFTDVTSSAGLNVDLQGMSAAAGDYDNDGLPDLYITCVGTSHLFHNRGKGRFEDVTEQAGVGGEDNTWSTGATWLDHDNDGKLDLVVAHYARWAREMPLEMAFTVARVGHSYGAPTGFVGVFPTLYRNLGDGRFAAVRDSGGLRAVDAQSGFPTAKTLSVIPADVNEDGKLDLLFTFHINDAALFVNQGNGTFRRVVAGADQRREGISAGLGSASSLPFAQLSAANERFGALHAMMTRAQPSAEGYLDLTRKLAIALLDYDLDGRVDVFSATGRAEPDVGQFEAGRNFESTAALFWNSGTGFIEAPSSTSGGTVPNFPAARGIASADFDGDGDVDVVVAQHNGAPVLWRNDQRGGLPWLQIELIAHRGVRQALGARVEVHTPNRVHIQTVTPAMSYMAQSAAPLIFGLGDDARVRRVVVLWPNGGRSVMRPEGVNRKLVITEP